MHSRTPKKVVRGTHRTSTVDETLRRIVPLLSRFEITRVANVTGLDVIGLPVFAAHRPNSRSLSVSFGKGMSTEAARASAIMESIEGYHAERVLRPLVLGSQEDLISGHRLADVSQLPRGAGSAFRPDAALLWVEGVDVANECAKWVPYELVHMDLRLPLPSGTGSFFMSSNGLASGNHTTEATLHGLCEVVERDATTLWSARGHRHQETTRLNLDTIDDEGCREILARFKEADLAVAVWETTSDVGVASFICTLLDRHPSSFAGVGPVSGMGCHSSRGVALSRALTEAAQGRLTIISGARDDLTSKAYDDRRADDRLRRVAHRLSSEVPVRRFSEVPTLEAASFEEDLEWVLERLRVAGFREVVVVDLSLPEFGIPVVRVIVPGLEVMHDAPNYVPGPRVRSIVGALT